MLECPLYRDIRVKYIRKYYWNRTHMHQFIELFKYNIINTIIGICFPFNYIISTVESWLEVVIYFDICVCVMCTDGQYCLMYIENKLINYKQLFNVYETVWVYLE